MISGEAGEYHLTVSGEHAHDVTLLVAMNAHQEAVQLWLPPCRVGTHWEWIVDTDRDDGLGSGRLPCGTLAQVAGHSVIVMVSVTEPDAEPPTSQPPAAHIGNEPGQSRMSEPPPPPTLPGSPVLSNIPPRRPDSRLPKGPPLAEGGSPQVPNPASEPGITPSESGGPEKK